LIGARLSDARQASKLSCVKPSASIRLYKGSVWGAIVQ
jgi:hypothetical protein